MNILKNKWLLTIMVMFLLAGCSVTGRLQKELETATVDSDYFSGVTVVEAISGEKLIDVQGHKYFTPASNVKLYTLYAALKILGDSVPSFEYARRGDSLMIRGTADPMFFNDTLHSRSLDFLKQTTSKIFLMDEKLEDEVYGPGWSWEDYSMRYMPEKSVLPLFGNTVSITGSLGQLTVVPAFFKDRVTVVKQPTVARDWDQNHFYIQDKAKELDKTIPFRTSNQLTADLLSQELEVKVTLLPPAEGVEFKQFYDVPYDSLYSRMIKESDNFIAEQLLLQVGRKMSGKYNSKSGIDFVMDNYLNEIPQRPRWVDGSGLSRYNLFSPQGNVYLLRKMYQEIPENKLFSYFPDAGKEGTLKGYFQNMPYLRAKSGTLSNNYCLSGYLTTRKGTLLVFSYMTNHYPGSSAQRKSELAAFLRRLHEAL